MPRDEPEDHPAAESHEDAPRGDVLINELRHGWAPLPTSTIFSLVLAGLRVRLTRSLVTMLAVILAIAFLTYTGLNNKLTHNLASTANELAASPGVPAAEVSRAIAVLSAVDLSESPIGEPVEWLGLWIAESPDEIREQLEFAQTPPADTQLAMRLRNRLDLLLWTRGERPDADPSVLSARAYAFLNDQADRFLPTFRNPSIWSSEQRERADFLLQAFHAHPSRPAETAVLEQILSVEERREVASNLLRLLRGAGVNIEATLRGDFADTWIIVMALLLCTVGIANAMLMSVTERFREIGTMKCLGAQDGLVVKLFLLESAFLGVTGAVLGAVLGILVALGAGLLQFRGFALGGFPVLDAWPVLGGALVAGILLAVAGTMYPAVLAARMNPVDALRIDE